MQRKKIREKAKVGQKHWELVRINCDNSGAPEWSSCQGRPGSGHVNWTVTSLMGDKGISEK